MEIRWARVLAVLLVALLAIEGATRLAILLWAGQPYRSLSPYKWSPYGLVRSNPNLTSPGFRINRDGFRNLEEFSRAKPPRTLRVMLLGGSAIYSGLGRQISEGAGRVDSTATIAQYLARELRADPALAGIDVEVINAAVNYNRIVEVAESYVAEYSHWDPDVVIVGGSANNFQNHIAKGSVDRRETPLQAEHPWRLEFERLSNSRTFSSSVEHLMATVGDGWASFAIFRKMVGRFSDRAFAESYLLGARFHPIAAGTDEEPADFVEYDRYIEEYLGYLDAILAVARRHHQEVGLFWEHALANLGGVKPLSPDEKVLYEQRRSSFELDARFDNHARERVGSYLQTINVPFVDPLDALKQHEGSVFVDYLHYTSEGNEFMARQIHEQMKDVLHRRADEIRHRSSP
jgi:hypothetical protein